MSDSSIPFVSAYAPEDERSVRLTGMRERRSEVQAVIVAVGEMAGRRGARCTERVSTPWNNSALRSRRSAYGS
jgi:hypothetical protein